MDATVVVASAEPTDPKMKFLMLASKLGVKMETVKMIASDIGAEKQFDELLKMKKEEASGEKEDEKMDMEEDKKEAMKEELAPAPKKSGLKESLDSVKSFY